tara:strand:- start:54 stop:674 length:621 start_codon:yes stop_codon:yes gene_type:complete
MARGLDANINTILAGNSITSALLLEIGLPASDSAGLTAAYFTTAPFDISLDTTTAPDSGTNVYKAQGKFIALSNTRETATLQITSLKLTLSALDPETVSTFATADIINKDVTVHRIFFDQSTNAVISDSAGATETINMFAGKIGGYKITETASTATLTLEIQSQLANFTRTNGRVTTNASLQNEHANDFGFEYAHETDSDINWGQT